jgi:hypothetical protein
MDPYWEISHGCSETIDEGFDPEVPISYPSNLDRALGVNAGREALRKGDKPCSKCKWLCRHTLDLASGPTTQERCDHANYPFGWGLSNLNPNNRCRYFEKIRLWDIKAHIRRQG